MDRGRILAVGDCVLDILCSPVGSLPEEDIQLVLPVMHISPGGNTLNFSLAASALGAPTEFHGALGDDAFAGVLSDFMRRHGVIDRSIRDPELGTSTTIALSSADGRRRLLTYPGANGRFHIDPSDLALDDVFHVHRGGYWWIEGLIGSPTIELFRRARRMGIDTSMDPATHPDGWKGQAVDALKDTLRHVTYLMVNEAEIRGLSGEDDLLDGSRELLNMGAECILAHLGRKGIMKLERDDRDPVFIPSIDGIPTLNPTGCGDVFNGGFIAGLYHGMEVPDAIGFGIMAAVLHLGSSDPVYPDRMKVHNILLKNRQRLKN